MSMPRTPMITLRVVVSDRALPKRDGSSSLFKIAYCAFAESFCCSFSFASSASVFVFTAYLYNLMIRMSRMSLRDFTTFTNLSEPPVVKPYPGITLALSLLSVVAITDCTTSTSQPMSGIRDSVAMMSSHQKKLNLKSLTTHELMKISRIKSMNERHSPV